MGAVTQADVVDARRWFTYSHVEAGSGWFKDAQTADDLFDSIASQNGFTARLLRSWAKAMRQADGGHDA